MQPIILYGSYRKEGITLPAKITADADLHDMTFLEIQKLIWQDIHPATHIGLRDRFTDEALNKLIQHPSIDEFPFTFRSWLWNALETMMDDEEQAA